VLGITFFAYCLSKYYSFMLLTTKAKAALRYKRAKIGTFPPSQIVLNFAVLAMIGKIK
jgi:hypothetical protein